MLTKNFEQIKVSTNMAGCIRVDKIRLRGSLALLWCERLDVTLLSKSPGHINTLVKWSDKMFQLTKFYGNPDPGLKEHSWTLLKRLQQNFGSWFVCRDFNEIAFAIEKIGGGCRSYWQMALFRETLDACELCCIPYRGYKFT